MTRDTGPEPGTEHDRSIGELVSDLSEQVSRLVRDEMRLAVAEMRQKGKRFGVGTGLTGAAGVVALLGAGALVAAAILGLATAMPGWAAALIVGGALVLIAALLGGAGRSQLKRATPPVPKEAVASVEADVEAVKRGVRS